MTKDIKGKIQHKIGYNLKYIEKHPVRITIESRHLPGGADHNLICWICDKKSAIYSMYPYWMFLPCYDCQGNIKGEGIWNILKKKWWEFWK